MNVLHVIDKMDPERGGVCQAVRTIAFGLETSGVYNEIVSVDYQDAAFLAQDSLIIQALGPADNPLAYSKKLSVWLKQNITRYDVIIVHGLWQYPSYAAYKSVSRIKKRYEVKGDMNKPRLYVMPHGMLDPYFQKAPGRKLKAIRNLLYWKFVEGKVINNADGLLFTCEAERKLAHMPFKPYKPKKEFVVGLGVDAPPVFSEVMLKTFFDKCTGVKNVPYLLFLSRIHEKKGVDVLLQSYLEVKNSILEKKLTLDMFPKLVIAGPGLDTAYGKKIKGIVDKNLFLKNNVFFPGMLKGNVKWGAFYGCEAFILPSHQENFGIAVVEALACSKPVLISNQVNIWTEIESSAGGFVANDTVEGTVELISAFTTLSTEEKQKVNTKARACFETYFAVGPASKKMIKAISLQNSNIGD